MTGGPKSGLLNAWPQALVAVDGLDIHCVHVEGRGPDPIPLVATHGWPSSFFEMHKIIGPLTDPASHGGDPADAFHLVVPSLPGYGFSSPPTEPGVGAARVADLWVALMDQLGYARFGSHGGDWGSAVTTALGAAHPERMIGLHFSMLSPPVDPASLTSEQRALVGGAAAIPGSRVGLRAPAAHQAADAGVRLERLPRRAGRLDPREVVALERLRRRGGDARPAVARTRGTSC